MNSIHAYTTHSSKLSSIGLCKIFWQQILTLKHCTCFMSVFMSIPHRHFCASQRINQVYACITCLNHVKYERWFKYTFQSIAFSPLLITSYRRFKINLSTWLTNSYFKRAFCLWAKKLAVDSGIMWQKAETCKITKEILKVVHPKISFADKQQFQQAAVLCILPRSRENPHGSQIVNQNFITDKVQPPRI